MKYYIGLDVSQRQTAICGVDEGGKRVFEGKALTIPLEIWGWINKQGIAFNDVACVGLEAGAMSSWLTAELTKLKLPTVCLEAYQAHRFLKNNRNKTDKNDARGLAQLVRMGGDFLRIVSIRTQSSQESRLLLTLRQNLVGKKIDLENVITGSLKPFGIVVSRGKLSAQKFKERVLEALRKADALGLSLREAVMPPLCLHEEICKQLAPLTKQVEALAKKDPICRRLMTAPGVGPLVALSFMTAIDTPERFSRSEDVGAYLGLTPKQYQSGEIDFRGGISRLGNSMTRSHLVQAATVLLLNGRKNSVLRAWGLKISKRKGFCKARIAVARKLAIILHKMWLNERDFCWNAQELADQMPA